MRCLVETASSFKDEECGNVLRCAARRPMFIVGVSLLLLPAARRTDLRSIHRTQYARFLPYVGSYLPLYGTYQFKVPGILKELASLPSKWPLSRE